MKKIFEETTYEDEKIITIVPHKHNGYWMFEKNNKFYNIGLSNEAKLNLSPLIWGIDKLMIEACKNKNIQNYEKGFKLMFSLDFFFKCDVKIEYLDTLFGGWVYKILPEYFVDVPENQKVWICPYLNFYFSNPPNILYVKVDSK
jgi:hypothetical protein